MQRIRIAVGLGAAAMCIVGAAARADVCRFDGVGANVAEITADELAAPNVRVQNALFDAILKALPGGERIVVHDARPVGAATGDERNRYDPDTNSVQLDCVGLDSAVLWGEFGVTSPADPIELRLNDYGMVREASRTVWSVEWGPCDSALPSHEVLVLEDDGEARLGELEGTWAQTQGRFAIQLFGGTTYTGTVRPGGLKGSGNHLGEDMCLAGHALTATSNLDLYDGRFRVQVEWRDSPTSAPQQATAVPGTDRSGYFWFFQPDNIELTVRILDGCADNGHFWFFAAGVTNVEYELQVTDTQAMKTQIYTNPLGNPAAPIQDTQAFATCP